MTMSFDDLFPSNYLRQSDFPTPRVLVIDKITREVIHRPSGKETESVLHFRGSKPMVLNKTNGTTLFRLYGHPNDWTGKEIEVYADPGVMKGKDRVGGIRVRKAAGPAGRPAPSVKSTPAKATMDPATIEKQYATALDVLRRAATPAMVDEWSRWIKKFDFSLDLKANLQEARDAALQRIALASRPAAARQCA